LDRLRLRSTFLWWVDSVSAGGCRADESDWCFDLDFESDWCFDLDFESDRCFDLDFESLVSKHLDPASHISVLASRCGWHDRCLWGRWIWNGLNTVYFNIPIFFMISFDVFRTNFGTAQDHTWRSLDFCTSCYLIAISPLILSIFK